MSEEMPKIMQQRIMHLNFGREGQTNYVLSHDGKKIGVRIVTIDKRAGYKCVCDEIQIDGEHFDRLEHGAKAAHKWILEKINYGVEA